ncbi:MAG: hypothetical protein RR232_07940 [Clostridia bacterium]
MKKTLGLLLATILLACAFTGCYALPAEDNNVQEPQTRGMQRIFGKDVTVALLADSEAFEHGVLTQAESLGVTISKVSSAAQANGFDLVIAYKPDSVADITVPLIVYTEGEDNVPDNGRKIIYNKNEEQDAALEVMRTFVSHEAPVRMLGVFAGEHGEAQIACQMMEDEGKAQIKGTCTDLNAGEQITKLLDEIPVGVLDTIFTENGELAMEAYGALKAAERNDAVEVITMGLDIELVRAMVENHFLMGAATGANEWSSGALALRMGLSLLSQERVGDYEIKPFTVYSDEVIAATKAGEDDIESIIMKLDGEVNDVYWTDNIRYLADHYGK